MMRIYANLLGNWTDITDEGTVADNQEPSRYFKDMLSYGEGTVAEAFKYGYINVQYQGKNYRLDPSHIQIVS